MIARADRGLSTASFREPTGIHPANEDPFHREMRILALIEKHRPCADCELREQGSSTPCEDHRCPMLGR